MVDDGVLSRETAYMYQYITGFEPVKGNLTFWKGVVTDSKGRPAELEVHIPDSFPYDPPRLELAGTTNHPRVGNDGSIITRTIQNWDQSNHIFSVVREAKSILSTGEFQSIQKSNSSEQEQVLRNQVNTLRSKISESKQELESLKHQSDHEVATTHNIDQLIDETLIDVENEAYALEEAYDNLDLKAIDFAKNFVDARKRYYMIETARSQM